MELDAKSVFVLLHGDILAIKKSDLINDMEIIIQIQKKYKFIVNTLPYSYTLTY